MTLSTQTSRIEYTANGSQATFNYSFEIFQTSDMKVYKDGVLQTSGYSVTGVGNDNGGTVVFSTAPASGVVVRLARVTAKVQELVLREFQKIPVAAVEKNFDKIVAMIQELAQSDSDINIELDGLQIQLDDLLAFLQSIALQPSAQYVGETQPEFGFQGMRWYNPSAPATYVFYYDGDSGQWVQEAHEGVDGALRSDLASPSSTVPIAGVPANKIAKAIVWSTPSIYSAPAYPSDAGAQLTALLANEQFILIDKPYASSVCLRPKADQVIWFVGDGRLDAIAKVGGGMSNDYGGILAQIMFVGVSNVTLVDPHLDGRCDTQFGGRIITGDAQEKPHGILVLPGCDNINVIRPKTFNIGNFSCIHLSNGVLGQSKNIVFDKPTGNHCGGGVGVEILFAGTPDGSGLYGSSPGRTVINNPVYTDTHYPSYYAGCEDLEVNGGFLQSSRLQPITLYTGDAQGVLNAVINGGVYDSSLVTGITAPQPLLIRSVNIASENALQYKKASQLNVVMNGTRFKNLTSGASSEIFDGCDVTLNDVKFEGGKLVLSSEFVDAVGVVTKPLKISGGMKGFSGKGVIADWDIDQHNFEYDTSVAGNNDCLWLRSATAKAYLHRVSFGNPDNAARTVRHGVEFDNPNTIVASALAFNGSGAQYSALESNTYNLTSVGSSPAHPFDVAPVRQRSTIPTHTPVGSQPRTVIHSDAISGEPTYWYHNGSSWVGMALLP